MNQQKDKKSKKCLNKRPVTFSEIIAADFKHRAPIFTRGILPAGGGMILAGDSGVGKSLIRLEWSILLASGLEVLDFGTPRSQSVIVFQIENTIENEQYRGKRMITGLDLEGPPQQLYYAPPIYPANIKSKHFANYVLDCIHEVRATVAIFDPLISFHQENENDNVKMRGVLEGFTYLSRQTGAAIILIHHFGKPSEAYQTNEYRMRGAQAIRDWADTAITITPVKAMENEKYAYRKLEFIKIRSGPHHLPLIVKRNKYFLHEITEDILRSPTAMLKELVKTRGMEFDSKKSLIEELSRMAETSQHKAKEIVEQELEAHRITEIISLGARGFQV